ncbi:toll-like receptor Tollo [Saccostrea cucullata]|uniref:toll-like receptor Tollo n=1 Tax=Saccostrea cuccullata TaxID=36930 RepID=UPI002ED2A024
MQETRYILLAAIFLRISTVICGTFTVSVEWYPGKFRTYDFNRSISGECILSMREDVVRCMRNHKFQDIEDQWRYQPQNITYIAVNCLRQEFFTSPRHVCMCKKGTKAASAQHFRQFDEFYYCQLRQLTDKMFASLRNLQVLDLSDNMISHIEGDALKSVTSLKYLDLSRNPMETQTLAAGFLCDAPGLEILVMQGTRFHGFPLHIFDCNEKLMNLSYIDFSDSLMHSIPHNAFKNIPNILSLNLTSNNINNTLIQRDAFVGLTKLVSVDFTENDLTSVPVTLCAHAPELQYLHMSENRLPLFDFQAIHSCKNLLFLDLSHNDIRNLVGRIISPSPLRSLRISKNFITELPTEGFLYEARNLTTLDLSMNSIKHVSRKAFDGLSSLKKLDLSDNLLNISSFPLFPQLQILEELDVSVNSFRKIQSGFFEGLKSLNVLNLSRNDLEVLESNAFDGLKSLTILDLRNNRLSGFEDSVFSVLKNLKTLYLTQNRIISLDQVRFPSFLGTLNAANNRLEHFPPSISNTNIKEVILDNNEMTSFSVSPNSNFSSITSLSLSNNLIKTLIENSFKTFSNLKQLNFSRNCLALNLSRDYFNGADSISTLDLSNNRIQNINGMFSTFESLSKLQNLYLYKNPITRVHNLIPELLDMNAFTEISLENIYLSFCNISHVSVEAFDGFPNLNLVDLSGNELTVIKPFKTSNPNTVYNLTRNPLECSCAMRWITERGIKVGDQFISTNSYKVDFCTVYPYNYTMKVRDVEKIDFLCKTQDECPTKCVCLGISETNNTTLVKCSNVTSVPAGIPRTSLQLFLDGNSLYNLNFTTGVDDHFLTEELYINNSHVELLTRDFFRPFQNLKKLVLSNNYIKKLENDVFSELKNLEEMHLRNNSLKRFGSKTLPISKQLKLLDISYNQIKFLDSEVLEAILEKRHLRRIYIGNNALVCNCRNQALRYWMDEHRSRIFDRESIKCENNQEMSHVRLQRFTCAAEKQTSLHKGIIVTSVILVSLVFLGFVSCFYFRRDIIAVIGTKLNINCLRHEYDQVKVYDVFLMFDFNDPKGCDWSNKELLPKLNNSGYKITTSDSKDLAKSLLETENTKLRDSKCALFVVTKYICNNQYYMNCFRSAQKYARENHRFKLIIVIVGDIDHSILEPELRKTLSTGNYITARSRCVWERLAFELPKRQFLLQPFAHENEVDESETAVIVYSAAGPGRTEERETVEIK